jgi:predicted nucleic acid-binding protein
VAVQVSISFADCFLVTPARKMDAVIMTGDLEFKNVEHIIEIEWLAK